MRTVARIAVVLIIALHTTASARIGEGLDELKKRWGKCVPLKNHIGATYYAFQNKPWLIGVSLHEDKACYIEYQKLSKEGGDIAGGVQKIVEHEIAAILKLNSNGEAWKVTSRDENKICYGLPSDPDMFASYDLDLKTLTVMSLTSAQKAAENAADKSVDGL